MIATIALAAPVLAVPIALAPVLVASAEAQVTLDLRALDALPPPARPQQRRTRRPTHPPAQAAHRPPEAPVQEAMGKPAASPPSGSQPSTSQPSTATNPAALPSVPAAPPPEPPASVATIAPAPPAAIPALAPAPVPAPAPTPSRTMRVAFAPGQSDLAAPEAAALADLVHAAGRGETTSFEIAAYAPASEGDASTARRLSLARALAVRSALTGAGVPGSSIYMRALGAPPADQPGSADRAVVTVLGAGGADSATAAATRVAPP